MAKIGVHQRVLVLMLTAGLAISACAKKEPILPGTRLDIRDANAQDVVEPTEQLAPVKVTQISTPPAQNYSQWTHKNGSTAHIVSHPALTANLVKSWSQNIGAGNSKKNRLTSDPIVAAGRVYTLDANAGVRAFSLQGATLWSRDLTPAWDKGSDTSGGGLAFGGGVLVATTGFGEVISIDPATGNILWRHRTNAAISSAPLVSDGLAIAVSLNNKAVALELANGRIRWQIQSGGTSSGLSGAGTPAAVGDFVVIPFTSGELVGANISTGARVWSAAVTGGRKGIARGFVGAISGDPVIAGDTVYAANQAGRLISIDRKTGGRNWTVNDGAYGPVWAVGGSVFMVTDGFELKRLDAATGGEVWAVSLPGYLKSGKRRREAHVHYGPVLAGNRLLVASSDGAVRSFNASTGAELGSVKIAGGAASQPAIVNGILYILSGNGQIQAFK